MLRFLVPFILCALLSFLAGCNPSMARPMNSGSMGDERLKVVATTTIVADLVDQIGGGYVEVKTLMGPGVDPHLYKASPKDVALLQDADVIFVNGLNLEGKLGQILDNLGRNKPVIAVTRDIPQDRLIVNNGAPDPHVWGDASLWSLCVKPVAETLKEKAPKFVAEFELREKAAQERYLALHEELKAQIQAVPKERRVLITAHDAFEYFGRAYGVEVHGIQGLSTESEAGLSEINRLVDLIVRRDLPAVFVETSVSQKNVQALVEGARARGHQVKIGGALYSDALGGPESNAASLVTMLRANASTMVEALK